MRRGARFFARLRLSTTWTIVLVAGSWGIPAPPARSDEPTDSVTISTAIIESSDEATGAAEANDASEPGATTEAGAVNRSTASGERPAVAASKVSAAPTHRQTGIIQANVDGQPQASLTCFCLTPDDRIVAGCAGNTGEIRVFDADGKYLESWSTPVKPEAIYACADGTTLLAGEGRLLQFSQTGDIVLEKDAPHAKVLHESVDKIREEVIVQTKQRAEMYAKQTKVYDEMIERVDQQVAAIKEQLAALDQPAEDTAKADDQPASTDEGKPSAARNFSQGKQMLQRRLAMHEQTKQQYESAKAQWDEMMEQNPARELTETELEEQVQSSIAYKLKASSISAAGEDVFLATHAAVGYGFEIWRLDNRLENGTRIVSDLSGCCGQMDVKACEHGLYVAENSRHRVCRFDREGELLDKWGHSARTGLEGFGSCCNPMNVAFGPDGAVYTAEDNTGRIKRYSADGKLLGLVGSIEVVPGCKNVSIAVSSDGSRVYMLDITQGRIVRMDARPADELAAPAGEDPQTVPSGESATEASADTSPPRSTGAASAFWKSLKAFFSSGD